MRPTELCDERLTNYLVRSELCHYIWAINEQHAMNTTKAKGTTWAERGRHAAACDFSRSQDRRLIPYPEDFSLPRDGNGGKWDQYSDAYRKEYARLVAANTAK